MITPIRALLVTISYQDTKAFYLIMSFTEKFFPIAQAGLAHSKRAARQKFFRVRCNETDVSFTLEEALASVYQILRHFCLTKCLECATPVAPLEKALPI